MQPKVSIIVPVYNVEAYLRECMESLVNQTLSDIEIIAVNDGSPDKSIDILEEYRKNHPDIVQVYTTDNHGVSHARNYGLARATGEFVMFVDSDDSIVPDMCKQLYEKAIADNNDLVLCRRYDIRKGMIIETGTLPSISEFSIVDEPEQMLDITPFPWDKLYKRSVIESHPFPEDMRFEDLLWFFSLLPDFKCIGYVNEPLYHYRRTVSGFMNTFTEATLDIVTAFSRIKAAYEKRGLFTQFKDVLEYLTVRHFFFRFRKLYADNRENGELELKIKLIENCIDFLNTNYPDWQDNPYLAISPVAELRRKYKRYFNKAYMLRYIRNKETLPAPVMKCLEYLYDIPYKIETVLNKIRS